MNPNGSGYALSVVIIGRNEGSRLVRCIRSAQAMRDIRGPIEIIYVDSASQDGSAERARALGARVIVVHPERPSAALGRNAGWRAAQAPVVLFLDGDTILDPDFAARALPLLKDPNVAVVWGHRRELHPEASIYNRVLDLDWIYPPGPSEFCGGDALMRRASLERVNGFDERLIAGEEPELCQRLRTLGYRIEHIDQPMTLHDLAMTRWDQYWRRAERAGHAYAEVASRFRDSDYPLWSAEVRRNRIHAAILILAALGGIVFAVVEKSLWPLLLPVVFYLGLIVRTARRVEWKDPSLVTRLLYGVHSHLQQIPILIGQLSYYRDRRAGRRRRLIEYK
ncbi:glycosyltransferase family 2 protein [Thiocapsa sp.]|uniref:glycosyltransferase n=1 Tax=Thiocapsa sp. TaxID=2024551 RepID=UPI003592F74C